MVLAMLLVSAAAADIFSATLADPGAKTPELSTQEMREILANRTATVFDSRPRAEYAVSHLGTRLIVVLGHERCGEVTAALGGDSAPGHINSLVRDIQPAVAASKGKEGDALANAIHENDAEVATKIRKQAQLGELASQVRIVEGYYDLDTGKVEWSTK